MDKRVRLMTLDEIYNCRERMVWREYTHGVLPPFGNFARFARFVREMANLEMLRAQRAGREFTPIYWYRQPGEQPVMTLWDMNEENK